MKEKNKGKMMKDTEKNVLKMRWEGKEINKKNTGQISWKEGGYQNKQKEKGKKRKDR